jgi:hypothetical protein
LTRRLLLSTAIFWAVAALSYGALVRVYGERAAYVHVRWAASVDAATRADLQRHYALADGELREGRTWGYYLSDLSTSNIRALVLDTRVEDTHQIDRERFRIAPAAPRAPYVGRGAAWIPPTLEAVILLSVAAGIILGGVALAGAAGVSIQGTALLSPIGSFVLAPGAGLRDGARATLRWVRERIPPASAESVAAFRMVFGTALVAVLVMRPVSSEWVTDARTRDFSSPLQDLVMQALLQAPSLADWLTAWTVFWGALFVIGAITRVAFLMLTAAVFAWAVLYTTRIGAHSISALMITLVCLTWSRWGDAWSLDAWRRRGRAGLVPRPPQEYGYTIWVPGLVLGVTFAAAALAKLREGGLAWILNGTVKYHFLSDSSQAPTDWGLRLGLLPTLAVVVSFAAVAVEALVIVGVCSRAYRYRAAAGVAALAILTGFVVFQGIFWPAWWILLLSFLPWHAIRPGVAVTATAPPLPARTRAGPHTAHVAIVLAIVGQQIVASALKAEIDPLISAYDMYSTTYRSPEDYERQSGTTYWLVVLRNDGTTESCVIDRSAAMRLSELIHGAADREEAAAILDSCVGSVGQIAAVSIEGRRTLVDWRRWRLAGEATIPLAGPARWQ